MGKSEYKHLEPINTGIDVIVSRKMREVTDQVTDMEINAKEIGILKESIDERLRRNGSQFTAEDVLKELSELIINKYELRVKSSLCELLVLLFDVLDL